jgi:hypothetical protein
MNCATNAGFPPVNIELAMTWRRLLAEERTAPPGARGGIARRRTELLADVPPWQVPALLDSLNKGDAL